MYADLEQAQRSIVANRETHMRQIDEMKNTEELIHEQSRVEQLTLRTSLSQLRSQHEQLELEYRQTLAHNEQNAPVVTEMRNLIETLKVHLSQVNFYLSCFSFCLISPFYCVFY